MKIGELKKVKHVGCDINGTYGFTFIESEGIVDREKITQDGEKIFHLRFFDEKIRSQYHDIWLLSDGSIYI